MEFGICFEMNLLLLVKRCSFFKRRRSLLSFHLCQIRKLKRWNMETEMPIFDYFWNICFPFVIDLNSFYGPLGANFSFFLRFEKRIFVGLPDFESRKALLKRLLNVSFTQHFMADIFCESVALFSHNFGALPGGIVHAIVDVLQRWFFFFDFRRLSWRTLSSTATKLHVLLRDLAVTIWKGSQEKLLSCSFGSIRYFLFRARVGLEFWHSFINRRVVRSICQFLRLEWDYLSFHKTLLGAKKFL